MTLTLTLNSNNSNPNTNRSELVNRDFENLDGSEPAWRRTVGRSVRTVGRAIFALHAGEVQGEVVLGAGGGASPSVPPFSCTPTIKTFDEHFTP